MDASDKTHCLVPTTSAATTRYDKSDKVWPRHHIVPMGMFSLGELPNPAYLPPLWESCVHPEGNVYFVRNSQPKIITEANLFLQHVQEKVAQWLDDIEEFIAAKEIYLAETVELTLDPCEDLSYCKYYLVDHASRVQFWLDSVTTDDLGLRTSVSENHLRHNLEELYWSHVEYFPSHPAVGFNLLEDELFDILLHARADQLSSSVSTIPFTGAECTQYLDILKIARESGRLHSTHLRWTIARLWTALCNHRHMIHYNQEHCRLSKDQSILDLPQLSESRAFSVLSWMSYGSAHNYKQSLEKLWVDELVYIMDWRPFISACQQDWMLSVSMSFALLLCNLVSFLAPFTFTPIAMLSIILCNGAILFGLALLMDYQSAQSMTAGEAVSILARACKPHSGFEHKAMLFSMPRTLLLWALGTFSVQGLAWFAAWTCSQRYGYIFVMALMVPVVGYFAVQTVRCLWKRWSYSRAMDLEAQSDV